MDFWSTIWDAIWWFFTIFVFVAYLIALFSIISDLFRDRELSGVYKAIWLLFLIFLPFLTALVYLIFRGRGMGDRAERQAREAKVAADDYIRTVAGGPASEIAQAKQLLDSGTISEAEFQSLKQSALDGSR
ncbi:SHOCT domain-containing protein [Micrococcus luteus]|uniref:SHOCT domain-containing protein n=1 Tax=Micrococcus luteus TaxID=1270 RepID=UPI001E4B840E|nr:SHOCT domain-containing protein [Micrococcus luteus]MCD0174086.1 SHOCT domain-containing protein [Micrococcus luteus]